MMEAMLLKLLMLQLMPIPPLSFYTQYYKCAKLLRDKVFYDKQIDYPKDGLVWDSDYAT